MVLYRYDVCLLGIMCSLCCHDYRGRHKVRGTSMCSTVGYNQVPVPQERGEDSPEARVHHGTGGVGCGSDGLRAEESHHEGVDPGGRGTGAG